MKPSQLIAAAMIVAALLLPSIAAAQCVGGQCYQQPQAALQYGQVYQPTATVPLYPRPLLTATSRVVQGLASPWRPQAYATTYRPVYVQPSPQPYVVPIQPTPAQPSPVPARQPCPRCGRYH